MDEGSAASNGSNGPTTLPTPSRQFTAEVGAPPVWVKCCQAGCGKWRQLPANTPLPRCIEPNKPWYCVNNWWDEKVASCAAPQERLPDECLGGRGKAVKGMEVRETRDPTGARGDERKRRTARPTLRTLICNGVNTNSFATRFARRSPSQNEKWPGMVLPDFVDVDK